jgi:predicted phage terminase large subunit-like protein
MVETGQAKRVAIISPTAADARDVAVEGESGLLNICPAWNKPIYESTKRRITWPNGAQASLFSAEEPERLRGPQFDFAWIDEIAGFDINTQQMTWDMLNFGLRLGKNPRAVVTTTPKPTPLIQLLVKMAKEPENRVIITTGSTYENRSNLAAPFMRQIGQYEGTNLGRQEIYAELIDIEESGIIKRTWFKQWPAKKAMPYLEFVIQSYDTAFTDKTENDPTGCVTFGVFRPSPEEPHCIMILDAWTEHLKYPELRKKAVEEYRCTYGDQEAKVDMLLIEDKGSGIPLIQDLQRAGLPIRKYNPGRPDKVMRLHSVSHLVYNGRVYIPESKKVPGEFVSWAEDFIREVCAFPNSPHDEYVDCFSQSLAVFRDQEWISVDPVKPEDPWEDDNSWESSQGGYVNPYAV